MHVTCTTLEVIESTVATGPTKAFAMLMSLVADRTEFGFYVPTNLNDEQTLQYRQIPAHNPAQ